MQNSGFRILDNVGFRPIQIVNMNVGISHKVLP